VSLGNGREELAFPAPANSSCENFGDLTKRFTGHMSPTSSGRVVPSRVYDQEVRRRAASTRDAIKQVARDEQTSREPSDAPRFEVTDLGADTVGLHNDRELLL